MRRTLLLACVLLLSCIERPETPKSRSANFDRSRLDGVVLVTPPTPDHVVGAVFGDAVELLGFDVKPEPAAKGQPVQVTFYWRVLAPLSDDWKVFVHLDDEGHRVPRVMGDHFPAQDRYPTSAWRAGEVVKDSWRFTAPNGPADALAVWTGFYRGDTRLPLTSAGEAVSDNVNRIRAGLIPLR